MSFAKGQPVTFLSNWDRKGTVRIVNLTVHSCGKKQMVLVDDTGVKFEGRFFKPMTDQGVLDGVVWPRLSDAEAEAAALALGQVIIEYELAHAERCIARYGYPEAHGYTKAMRKGIAELHEPRIYRK